MDILNRQKGEHEVLSCNKLILKHSWRQKRQNQRCPTSSTSGESKALWKRQ